MDHLPELLALRRRERAEHLARPASSRLFSYGSVCAQNHAYWLGERCAAIDASLDAEVLRGIACGPGTATGRARVVLTAAATAGLDGEIVVAERTDPGWIPLYPSISGLIIERGSVLSHSAVVAREMGIPTVVGVAGATQAIHTDDEVTVNGSLGTVQVVRRATGSTS
jgi:pyruvate,water dikinase